LSCSGFKNTETLLKQEAKIKDNFGIVASGGASSKQKQATAVAQAQQETSLFNIHDENSIANFVLFYNEDEVNNPKAYDHSYSNLCKWVDDSIDIYKVFSPSNLHFLSLVVVKISDQSTKKPMYSWNCAEFCFPSLFTRFLIW
jgi:hypothetical protein